VDAGGPLDGVRPDYASLPAGLRQQVEAVLGWRVVTARTPVGGWSPGVAAVVTGARGQRAFVKAASAEVNPLTPEMHLREARLTPLLPSALGGAELLGVVDEPPWAVLVLTALEGRPPHRPWTAPDLRAALDALAVLAASAAPAGLPTAEEQLADDLDRWPLLLGDPLLPPWEAAAAERLAALEAPWREAVAGDRLLHLDVRADNLLVGPDGRAVLVDWPSAGAGHPLLDLVAFAPSVALDGGPEPAALTAAAGVAVDDRLRVLVAGLLGLFRWRSLQPPPGGMPGVRAFQAAQADVLSGWLAGLTGW
jgi:hypothetical protein